MADAPERIRVAQDADGFWTCREAVSGSQEYVRADLYAALEAQLAEKEADNERLRTLVMAQSRAIHSPEAISRTGAVKVKALEWKERKTRLGTVWWSAPNPLGGLSIEAASENDKIAAQADFERRLLSALEPAAPESQQDDEPVAYRVHAPADEHYGIGPDRLQFHPLAQYDLDNGYRQTPLYTRPAEQAVTEAMVRAAAEILLGRVNAPEQEIYSAAAAALKAAMEAGR